MGTMVDVAQWPYPQLLRRLRRARLKQAARRCADRLGLDRWLFLVTGAGLAAPTSLLAASFLSLSTIGAVTAMGCAVCAFAGATRLALLGEDDEALAQRIAAMEGRLPLARARWEQEVAEQRRLEAERRRIAAEQRARKRAAREAEYKALQSSAVIAFDNQTKQAAVVKVVAARTDEEVALIAVGAGRNSGAHSVPAGDYYIKVRYDDGGCCRGDQFTLPAGAGVGITLHKVSGGNYGSRPIAPNSF